MINNENLVNSSIKLMMLNKITPKKEKQNRKKFKIGKCPRK